MKMNNKYKIYSTLCIVGIISLLMSAEHLYGSYTFLGNYQESYSINGNTVTFNCGTPKVKIEMCTAGIIKVWMEQTGNFESGSSYAVLKSTWPTVNFNVTDEGNCIKIQTGDIIIRAEKSPFRLSFYKLDNKTLITKERSAGGMGWDGTEVCEYMFLNPEEHFYGLGTDKDDGYVYDRKGHRLDRWADHFYYGRGTTGVDFCVPFFVSSGGDGGAYGIFSDNTYNGCFDMGRESANYYYFNNKNGELIYYFMYGPSVQEVIEKYTLVTGRPPMPPRWSFGYIQSKFSYESWTEVQGVVNTFRDKNIPLDCVILDLSWANCLFDLNWNNDGFPDAAAKVASFSDNGVKIITAVDAYVRNDCENFPEGDTNKYFALDAPYPEGNTKTVDMFIGPCALVDFTNPYAAEWWWNKEKRLIDEGVAGIWNDLDEPEGWYDGWYHFDGTHDKCHNIITIEFARCEYEGLRAHKNDSMRMYQLHRSGWAGSQRFGYVNWSGDLSSDFRTLQAQMPVGQNVVLSGIPYWNTDIGGFQGNPSNELYARWMQFGCFCPMTRAHHAGGDPEPWKYGGEVEEICRKYITLRYRFIPYTYSYAWKTHQTGQPYIIRPLVLDYEGDAGVYDKRYEWMFGENILVAPVYEEGAVSRDVYLPEGEWIDYCINLAPVSIHIFTLNISQPPQRRHRRPSR